MKLTINTPEIKKIKKPMVFAVVFVLMVTYGCLTFFPKGEKEKTATDEMNLTPTENMLSNDNLIKLPSTYADIKKGAKESEPLNDAAEALNLNGSSTTIEEPGILSYKKPEQTYTSRETKTSYRSSSPTYRSLAVELPVTKYEDEEDGPIGYGSAGRSGSSGGAPLSYNPAEGTEKLLASLVETQNEKEKGRGQSSKERFLSDSGKRKETTLPESIEKPKSPYTIFAGSIIPGAMVTGINSDLPGDIIAIVRENIYDTVKGRHVLIPQGTKIIGSYNSGVEYGDNRVLFAWDRLIYPNGDSIQLRGMKGADLGGYSGTEADVDNHFARLTGAIMMSSFMAIGTEKLDNGNTFRSTMAEDVNRSGQKIVDMQLNVKPTLKVKPGQRFNVMVNKDIILKPYRG